MSLHRYAPRRDKNESEIIQVLRAAGATVTEISGKGVPDLLCSYQNHTILAEVKSKHGRLTPAQDSFHSEWKGDKIYILRNVDDALNMLKDYQS